MEKLELIEIPIVLEKKITLQILRTDLIDPEISGNKWYKLKYNIEYAQQQNFDAVLTFGGAYSNHIAAFSAAAKRYDFKAIAIIRGEEPKELNPTLKKAVKEGSLLKYITRAAYREKHTTVFLEEIKKEFGNVYLIPEGGSNQLGVNGCTEILKNVTSDFDYCCCAVGTGATLAGIVLSLKNKQRAIGFSALKSGNFLEDEVVNFGVKNKEKFEIKTDYHFGGYAKYKKELIEFINCFYNKTKIKLDPVYTAKMMYGLFDLIKNDYFPINTTIIAVHTGGIQGITGFESRYGIQLFEAD